MIASLIEINRTNIISSSNANDNENNKPRINFLEKTACGKFISGIW